MRETAARPERHSPPGADAAAGSARGSSSTTPSATIRPLIGPQQPRHRIDHRRLARTRAPEQTRSAPAGASNATSSAKAGKACAARRTASVIARRSVRATAPRQPFRQRPAPASPPRSRSAPAATPPHRPPAPAGRCRSPRAGSASGRECSTTKVIVAPNSPIALAKARIAPAMMPGRISGRVTVANTTGGDAPKVPAACFQLRVHRLDRQPDRAHHQRKGHDRGRQRRPGPAKGEDDAEPVSSKLRRPSPLRPKVSSSR